MTNVLAVKFVRVIYGSVGRNYCSHRRLLVNLGDDADELIGAARAYGLIVSSGRGRNRAHRLTAKGLRLANNRAATLHD